MRTETPIAINLKDYQPSAWLIDHVSLDFRLEPNNTIVFARTDFRTNPEADTVGGKLVLTGENIRLKSIAITGIALNETEYSVTDKYLIIHEPPLEPFTLEIETVCNPERNTALSGLYRTGGNYCTQCEAEGFRRITYYLDRPDILARYRTRIEGEKASEPVLLSNGNKVLEGEVEGSDRHFTIWEDPFPKPSYLFALVAGDLARVSDEFITASGRRVVLEIYVEQGKQDRCEWAMQCLKNSMKWDEETFGREYDLDVFMIVAVSDFNMGAMENKGLNIFNDKYILAKPETATDVDYANIEGIIAHEYFHNWSGNRITCRDWFQLCLKEGLTVFRDQEFSSDMRSRAVKRISDVKLLRSHQFPEDAGPLAHPVRPQSYMEINNFYTATVYEKGAEVVRMIHTIIGKENFRKAMDLYFWRHDGQAATVEDFIACMSEVSGKNLDQFFLWYEQAGTPIVSAKGYWNKSSKTYQLTLEQSTRATPGQPQKKPFHIPIRIGLLAGDGRQYQLENDLVELKQETETFEFENIGDQPVLSINRQFSAPVKIVSERSNEERVFLLHHDSDSFSRWECGQILTRDIILAEMSNGGDDKLLNSWCMALVNILADNGLEDAFKALMLQLPGETDIAGFIAENVDPDRIHEARNKVSAKIGAMLEASLMDIQNMDSNTAYSPDAASSGARALRYAALELLGAHDKQATAKLCIERFSSAGNMSDEIGALSVLSRIDVPERNEALDSFYDRHKGDPLIVDKWFIMQAQAPFPETLGRVRHLMDHPAFSYSRPNTIRALAGSFAMNNPVCFHAMDGSGYEFIGDIIITLDAKNPQVAARLASAFRSWRMMEPTRRAYAKATLERILDTDQLSLDSYEIIKKSLD